MFMKLEVLPALEGDCLLLHWKDKQGKQKLSLIDGGPGRVYEETLLPRLKDIGDGEQLFIDLVMVSHVDDDHITGVKKLFAAMQKEIDGNTKPGDRLFKIGRLWHNAFDDIIGNTEAVAQVSAVFTASAGGELPAAATEAIAKKLKEFQGKEDAEHTAEDIALVLAGHAASQDLRNAHQYLKDKQQIKFPLNSPFDNGDHPNLIVGPQTESFQFEGLETVIFGPMQAEIEALQIAFDKFLEDEKKKGKGAETALAAYADKSVPNLSSLVMFVGLKNEEYRRSILLTGDARGDKILEGIDASGLFVSDKPLHFTVLKVPHHGSDRNVEPNFFDRIWADIYVLSANGKHENPDRETVEWIVNSREKADRYRIVLTYPVDDIDALRRKEYEKNQKKKKTTPWDDASMSLASFFAEKKADGYKFELVVGTGKDPIELQLGDE